MTPANDRFSQSERSKQKVQRRRWFIRTFLCTSWCPCQPSSKSCLCAGGRSENGVCGSGAPSETLVRQPPTLSRALCAEGAARAESGAFRAAAQRARKLSFSARALRQPCPAGDFSSVFHPFLLVFLTSEEEAPPHITRHDVTHTVVPFSLFRQHDDHFYSVWLYCPCQRHWF